MARWNILHRNRTRDDSKRKEIELFMQETENALMDTEDIGEESGSSEKKEQSYTQYDEVLYSKDGKQKVQPDLKNGEKIHRDTWENTSTIENKVDTVSISASKKSSYVSELEEKVDTVLAKKKKI